MRLGLRATGGGAVRHECATQERTLTPGADMIEEIRELYTYNHWANGRILDATAELSLEELTRDLGSSFPSVRDTLAHMLGAEWIWLSRWMGVSPAGTPASWDLSTHAAIRDRWRTVEEERSAFLGAQTAASLQRVIEYRNTAGEPFASPLWQMLRHVVNHASYHRGQITTMLRQLGRSAAATDLIVFYRQSAAAAVPPRPV
ncbi:MAG: DinB family protein [Longimicrobiales bacterium]